MDISCVLLTWNSERYVENCLNALLRSLQATPLTYQIFIVDNGSADTTPALLKKFQTDYPQHIFPTYLDHNSGTTSSRNLALRQASGKYLCIMDSDVEIAPGVFERLIETLDNSPSAGLVAPRLLYPDGQLQKSTDDFPTLTTKFRRYFFLKQIEQREHEEELSATQETQIIRPVDYAISALWLYKRKILERVGLLDEKIFYAPEDVDYCLRIWKAGYRVLYDPTVSCIHHTQEISRGLRINKAFINHLTGLAYYFKKHRYLFRKPIKF